MKEEREVIHLDNILDYHWMSEIIDKKAVFQAYDRGDNCVMFTVLDDEYNDFDDDDYPLTFESEANGVKKNGIVELSIYGYSQTYFAINKTADLMTEDSETIVITESYHSGGKTYVFNKQRNATRITQRKPIFSLFT